VYTPAQVAAIDTSDGGDAIQTATDEIGQAELTNPAPVVTGPIAPASPQPAAIPEAELDVSVANVAGLGAVTVAPAGVGTAWTSVLNVFSDSVPNASSTITGIISGIKSVFT
jgi:hypothetical protein